MLNTKLIELAMQQIMTKFTLSLICHVQLVLLLPPSSSLSVSVCQWSCAPLRLALARPSSIRTDTGRRQPIRMVISGGGGGGGGLPRLQRSPLRPTGILCRRLGSVCVSKLNGSNNGSSSSSNTRRCLCLCCVRVRGKLALISTHTLLCLCSSMTHE